MWAVVVFEDDNSIATIPYVWLFKNSDKQMSYWPPNTRNATNFVKKQEEPALNWPQYFVKVLGIYDDYDTAVKKSVTAEETSDLSSNNSIQRKRRKNKKYLPSSSSESEKESDLGSDLPDFPKSLSKKMKTVPEGTSSSFSSSVCNTERIPPLTKVDHTRDQSQNTFRMELHNISHNVSPQTSVNQSPKSRIQNWMDKPLRSNTNINELGTPESVNQDTEFKKKVLTKLNIICAKLSQYDDNFEDLRVLINQNKTMDEGSDDAINGLNYLPLENDNDLNNLEQFLADKQKSYSLAKELSRIGGNSVSEITKKIMYRCITSDFGQLYSWEGGKGKRKFIDLSISKVIFDAVRKNSRTRDACDDEIILNIKKWLVKAKERVNNKKKRLNKTNETEAGINNIS